METRDRQQAYLDPDAIAVAVTALGLTGGLAYAAIPSDGGVINGCYNLTTGVLRAVDSAADCRNGEGALAWNQVGQAGPQGPQGLQGPRGERRPSDVYEDLLFPYGSHALDDEGMTVGKLQLPSSNGAAWSVCRHRTAWWPRSVSRPPM